MKACTCQPSRACSVFGGSHPNVCIAGKTHSINIYQQNVTIFFQPEVLKVQSPNSRNPLPQSPPTCQAIARQASSCSTTSCPPCSSDWCAPCPCPPNADSYEPPTNGSCLRRANERVPGPDFVQSSSGQKECQRRENRPEKAAENSGRGP